ncbi:MAG: hypothetical protein C0490_04235 [Marivirga sp.]|nr:hypothetical protein [Marivirga sp.]
MTVINLSSEEKRPSGTALTFATLVGLKFSTKVATYNSPGVFIAQYNQLIGLSRLFSTDSLCIENDFFKDASIID